MAGMNILEWTSVAAVALVAAFLTLVFLGPARLFGSRKPGRRAMVSDSTVPVWIFDGTDLIDATARAYRIMDGLGDMPDWNDLRQRLSGRFPDMPANPAVVKDLGCFVVRPTDPEDHSELVCEWLEGMVRVQLRPLEPGTLAPPAAIPELDFLRSAVNHAPNPVWRVEESGGVVWYNRAYRELCETVRGQDTRIEIPLFSTNKPEIQMPGRARQALETEDGKRKFWFDITSAPQDGGRLYYASDINAVVDAEAAQRNFVQTLAKTFAQLSIGLAIFDRNRQLALFNPALIDLTALPAGFLSGRPNLLSFFDRLRDQHMIPEPKNYGSWRQQIADLVEAASLGRYHETWSMPSGSVYSVSGRPHPDGAVAFLFEDITAEITLTRRFRADLEVNQSVLDHIDDAIAVFSVNGHQSSCNAAYREMWGVDPDNAFAQITITDATRVWQEKCNPSPVFGEIRDFVSSRENRVDWTETVTLTDGSRFECCICPVLQGSTMVRFSRLPVARDSVLVLQHNVNGV